MSEPTHQEVLDALEDLQAQIEALRSRIRVSRPETLTGASTAVSEDSGLEADECIHGIRMAQDCRLCDAEFDVHDNHTGIQELAIHLLEAFDRIDRLQLRIEDLEEANR